MPAARKRKVMDSPEETQKLSKRTARAKSKNESDLAQSNTEPAIVGGLNGDYRITGTEQSHDESAPYKEFTIPADNDKIIPCRLYGPNETNSSVTKALLIFTHGAGGGIENPATKLFAEGYGSAEMSILLFQGTMNLQNRTKLFETVLDYCKRHYPDREYAVGGRSMGARAAVMLAAEHDEVQKVVAVSYPLVSPKGEVRDEILMNLASNKTVLFVTGDKDSMCDPEQLDGVRKKMAASSNVLIKENADHGMSLVGKVEDKATKIVEGRKEDGEMAAKWIRRAGSGDKAVLSIKWMAGGKQTAASPAKSGKQDGGKTAIAHTNDRGSKQARAQEGKGAGKKTKRTSDENDEVPSKTKATTKRQKSIPTKKDNKDEESDRPTRRRSARLSS